MRSKFLILLSICLANITAKAQKDTLLSHALGDAAPKLHVKEWIKGLQPDTFQKNKVYVVDFWATWCAPCISNMPHLSALARQYKDSITFFAIDVYESHANFSKTPAQLKAFVDKMGDKMSLNVAQGDTNTARDWLNAYNRRMIPAAFVIDRNGRVAWVGHPMGLDTILPKVLDKTWDTEKELLTRNREDYLNNLDTSIISKSRPFEAKSVNLGDLGLPDSILMVVDKMVKQEPELKYMPTTVRYTFAALLKTDIQKAQKFGQDAIAFARDKESARRSIIDDIHDDMKNFTTPKEIYLLGATCLQENIKEYKHVSNELLAQKYHEMAEWYRRGGDKSKAITSEEKAIEYWKRDLADEKSEPNASRLIGLVTN